MTSSFLLSENGTSSVERLERSYLECEDIARAASSSFFRSFRHLPEPKRRAVNALYAFCRRVDDIVDGDWLPEHNLTHLDEATTLRMEQLLSERKVNPIFSEKEHKDRLRALMFYREQLAAIQDGQPMTDPVFIALSVGVRRSGRPFRRSRRSPHPPDRCGRRGTWWWNGSPNQRPL